ncbi:RNA polymerase sigma-70 factor [Mesobacillus jeotgali]|uniref:RNA polymerase sigma-70 factor n=1 Tax=Mesobacillus jeotgali TaxID=129985 RepID=UPI002147230D|nr:RNA polymerase sigma-70 factor [Mesobacillus jeotgali]
MKDLFSGYRPLLFSIAYRMLGSVSDAEDIVQDVYLQISEKTIDEVENKKAYLCKMVTNRCIDYFKSARYKREVYIGPWLPEPLILKDHDPISEIMNQEALSFAFLLLLEKLNPIERAVFILREALGYDYKKISQIVGRSEPNCRKIFSRVNNRFPLKEELSGKPEPKNKETIQAFVSALYHGNIQKLEELLGEDVTLYSDGGGNVYAALKPVNSRYLVTRFILNIIKQNQNDGELPIVNMVNVNGEGGLLVKGKDNILTVISFHVKSDQIADIYIVRNPEKLKHVSLGFI